MKTPPKKILVVDDDSSVRDLLVDQLCQKGYLAYEAENGEVALAVADKQKVDVVFLDILMPLKEGLETLIELKQRSPAPKVIAMTGSGTAQGYDLLKVAVKFGADAILRKPFSPEEMFALLAG